MPIFEHGYRHIEGPREGHWQRVFAIARQGIRLHWQSRFLKRVILFSWTPFLIGSIVFFIFGKLSNFDGTPQELQRWQGAVMFFSGGKLQGDVLSQLIHDPSQVRMLLWSLTFYFFLCSAQAWPTLIVLSIVCQRMISEDVRYNTYQLYHSRPLFRRDYVAGKFLAAAFPLAMVTVIPALSMYLLSILFSPGLGAVLDTWTIPFRIIAFALVVTCPLVMLLMSISCFTTNGRYVAFGWVSIAFMGNLAQPVLSTIIPGSQWIHCVSLLRNAQLIGAWIFDLPNQEDLSAISPDFREIIQSLMLNVSHWSSLTVFAIIIVSSLWVLNWKLERMERGE